MDFYPMQCLRNLLTLLFAIALVPAIAHAQQPQYASCVSENEPANKVLTAPASMNLSLLPDFQSLAACAAFCRNGQPPPGADRRRVNIHGDVSQFKKGGYRYATFGSGNMCHCGDVINGKVVADGLCNQKRNCLNNLDGKCYVPQERAHMIIDLTPPAATSRGGVSSGSGAGATTTPLPQFTGNRRPNPPTVQPGGWESPFPLQYEGAYQMTWRNNGDPDGDRLTFGVIIWQYDWTGRRWMQVPTIRDQYGTYGMTWLAEDNYTFTRQNGLSPQTHYAWMVFACDLEKGPAALCSWSGWQLFRTQ